MSSTSNRQAIDRLVDAINRGDRDALGEDVILEWPQSGERIRGEANRREIYQRFPSLPKVTPRRLSGGDEQWFMEADLDYGDGEPYQCAFWFETRNGRITREVAYWAKPFPAPEWRAPWVERM